MHAVLGGAVGGSGWGSLLQPTADMCMRSVDGVTSLLRRARAAQLHVTRNAYGCGRQGSSAADDASDTLQQVIGALEGYK